MIIEQRYKEFSGWDEWMLIRTGIKYDDLDFEHYSIRINKDRQYHTANTKGFKEAYNKAMSWMMLNENNNA